ncbi:DNAH [Lepeophtheirus salmonis]|uniref:DNAH n=1 Tax=Lepeophtheirus salmonis TaxID=72036 RepID=A0A7R8D7G1_LEPSM|nr:DNAH [Lepeophtheirus salmonis]CAF3025452.1 DNAH [Lepeophtheirus salmonis]
MESKKLSSFRSKRRNTTQLFPYKSCQRLKARNPYFESKSIHRVSGYTTPITYIEASLPNSPTRQIEMLRQSSELSSYDLEEDFEQTQSHDEKKHVALLFREVDLDYGFAERVSIVNYILLDPKERKRLKISMAPPSGVLSSSCKFIIRAPVPWHQSYIISKQYCRHNLFITNPIMQRIKVIWDLRYASLRFVQVHQLRNLKTMEPLSPKDMEEKILNQCDSARNTLMKRWLPEIGMVFVTMRKEWRTLVPSKNNESLRQVQKFFNCVAALMSQQLRSMAIQSLMDFAQLMKKIYPTSTFDWKEDFIQNLVSEVMDIFDSNIIGPKEYIRSYEAYKDLLDGSVFEQKRGIFKARTFAD